MRIRINEGGRKPPIDLPDHLNRKTGAQDTNMKASTLYWSPLPKEDLRDTLKMKGASK